MNIPLTFGLPPDVIHPLLFSFDLQATMFNVINITKSQNEEYPHEINIKSVYTKRGGKINGDILNNYTHY
ncbi:hypothetical protein AC56_3782 [Escherichia coli 1-182-04_S3_C3]|nr:hypothetical protein AC56_3782 [Escherichia coli 1-182-04_S3_C3]EZJ89985.1 hypothetical protein AB99_3747 [Escherichia coli 1-182-04_S3_C1]